MLDKEDYNLSFSCKENIGKESKHNRKMNKKGISPLIATVLLVGFAVAVAAVVILWGTGVIRGQIDKTAGIAQGRLGCESQTEIDLGNAFCSGKSVVVNVENLMQEKLPNLRGRIVGDDGQASSSLANVPLNSNEAKNVEFVYDDVRIQNPSVIEVIPVLYSGSNQISCESKKVAVEIDTSTC